jgi:hypothetical protein
VGDVTRQEGDSTLGQLVALLADPEDAAALARLPWPGGQT